MIGDPMRYNTSHSVNIYRKLRDTTLLSGVNIDLPTSIYICICNLTIDNIG